MAYFAVVENNTVTNIIVADTLEIAEMITGKTCVEYIQDKPAYMGGYYDGKNFYKPEIIEGEVIPQAIE